MKIKLLCVGKTKNAYLKEALRDYIKRIRRYTTCEYIEIKAEKRSKKYSAEQSKARECERIQNMLSSNEQVVALDEGGTHYTSVEFSEFLAARQVRGDIKTLTFVTGGATGLTRTFLQQADTVISLSKMTFPHQLCRLMIAEQLYRAYTILAGEAYHKI